jgi:hypothetical protein
VARSDGEVVRLLAGDVHLLPEQERSG